MKPSVLICLVVAFFGGVAQLACAQHPASSTTGEELASPAPPSFTTPPKQELGGLGDNGSPSCHFSGSVGFGTYWAHGGGFPSGPLLGATGSVGMFGEHGGIGLGWTEFSSTKAGSWSYSHRP
jgi:hypothetical protein